MSIWQVVFLRINYHFWEILINEINKGGIDMPKLNELELQNVRHLIGEHEMSYQKLSSYAQNCTDPEVKQMFEKSAQDALNTKQKLMGFLNYN